MSSSHYLGSLGVQWHPRAIIQVEDFSVFPEVVESGHVALCRRWTGSNSCLTRFGQPHQILMISWLVRILVT